MLPYSELSPIKIRGKYYVYCPQHYRASENGLLEYDIILGEQKIGRPLKKSEVVYHLDAKPKNFDLSNIAVFRSSAHLSKFKKGHPCFSVQGIYVSFPKAYANAKGYKQKVCPVCEEQLCARPSAMCHTCRSKKSYGGHLDNLPPRDELKDFIYNNGIMETCVHFGVTPYVMDIWCGHYGIPSRKALIKQISPEDWEKL